MYNTYDMMCIYIYIYTYTYIYIYLADARGFGASVGPPLGVWATQTPTVLKYSNFLQQKLSIAILYKALEFPHSLWIIKFLQKEPRPCRPMPLLVQLRIVSLRGFSRGANMYIGRYISIYIYIYNYLSIYLSIYIYIYTHIYIHISKCDGGHLYEEFTRLARD